MVPTLQCGLVRSNFCLAMDCSLFFLCISETARTAAVDTGGAAFLNRNDRPVNRNDCGTFPVPAAQARPGCPVPPAQGPPPCRPTAGIRFHFACPRLLRIGLLLARRLR